MSATVRDRARALLNVMHGDEKHLSSALVSLDVLAVLYGSVMRNYEHGGSSDVFYLSKGHGPMGYYAVLAAVGELEFADLLEFGSFHARLGHHPDRIKAPAFGISSGSLGHGLGLAAGTALAMRIQGSPSNVFVMIGDGEMDEGSISEAIAYCGRARLSNLRVIILDNHSATWGWPGGVERRFLLEGWEVERVDGTDLMGLQRTLEANSLVRPRAIVVNAKSERESL